MLPFPEWKPDLSAYQSTGSQTISNVVPRADGYGPFGSLTSFTQALPAACRGFFYARKSDGSIAVFAGTATKLYLLDNTTLAWTDVSKALGSYSAVPSSDHWQFAQFGNFVLAVQANVVPQTFTLSSSTEFADLGGSPPQAAYISIVGRFVVLSGLLSTPYRIQWSGLNAVTTWTSGVNSSDFQDLPDGGIVRGVAGGEYGVICQDSALRRMIYSPGSAVVFVIERITEDKGLYAPLSLIRAGDKIFFMAAQGLQVMSATGQPTPIGKEKFDRTFFAEHDSSALQYVIGSADPKATRIYLSYRAAGSSVNGFDRILCYDYALERATPITASGEYLATLSQPGFTLEGLDQIGSVAVTDTADNGSGEVRLEVASTSGWTTGDGKTVSGVGGTTEANGTWTITVVDGTHIDLQGSSFANAYTSGGIVGGSIEDLTFSFDEVAVAATSKFSGFGTDHKLGFFTGANLEATLDSAEYGLNGRRGRVKGFRPVTDAATCYGSIGARETVQESVTYSTEQAVNAKGLCPANVSTRLARGRLRIPAGTPWTFATGVEPEFAQEGKR